MLRELMDRYPLMFAQRGEMDMVAGWYPVIDCVCNEIAILQKQEDLGFCWASLSECRGIPRWVWHIRLQDPKGAELQVMNQITQLVDECQRACHDRCMVCGEGAKLYGVKGWLSTTCSKHLVLLVQDPEAFVRLADMKPVYVEDEQ
jgi:hypothetical protein